MVQCTVSITKLSRPVNMFISTKLQYRFETSVDYKVIHINVIVLYRCFFGVRKCSSFLWWCRTY